MSSFAQIVTSFERTGNFPIEANYVFPTLADLEQFYSDPIQAATLHEGLLKVVESNSKGMQALYWVVKNPETDQLVFKELLSGSDIESIEGSLEERLAQIEQEIADREAEDERIWGTEDPSTISTDLNSIKKLADNLTSLKEALDSYQAKSEEINDAHTAQIKAIAGTTEDDVISYLDTLPYKSITELAVALDRAINNNPDGDATNAIDTLKEVTEFLDGYTNSDTLKDILNKLWLTIEGDILPSENMRTLRGIEDYLIKYKTTNDFKQATLLEELNNLETAVGVSADGSFSPDINTHYLQTATSVMNALQILDKLLHQYISANTPSVRNTDEAVSLTLTQELDSYVLAAAIKLSTQEGNQIVKNTDGLYSCAKTSYDKGILTFTVNDNIVSQHYIGMSAIVQSATYDKDNEQLVFVFKLDNGDTQTVLIPVGALIREWIPENRDTSPIVLERVEDLSGTDKLSADVRLSTLPFNILVRDGNTLYVKGSTDSIYHDGVLLKDFLTTLVREDEDTLEDILKEIDAAKTDREAIRQSLADEATERIKVADTVIDLQNEILAIRDSLLRNYTIIKQDEPEEGYIATYVFTTNGVGTGEKINIPEQPQSASMTFEDGVITLIINGKTIASFDIGLNAVVEELRTSVADLNARIDAIKEELNGKINENTETIEGTNKALSLKASIESPEFTGTPTVAETIDTDDSSSRIASTAWTQQQLALLKEYVDAEIAKLQNSSGSEEPDNSVPVDAEYTRMGTVLYLDEPRNESTYTRMGTVLTIAEPASKCTYTRFAESQYNPDATE